MYAPVSFARDTAAACVAELVAGRGRDLKSFLYLFVDTFVGGGLVINSHLADDGGAAERLGALTECHFVQADLSTVAGAQGFVETRFMQA